MGEGKSLMYFTYTTENQIIRTFTLGVTRAGRMCRPLFGLIITLVRGVLIGATITWVRGIGERNIVLPGCTVATVLAVVQETSRVITKR